MPPIPSDLPSTPWGFASLVVVLFGSYLILRSKKQGDTKQVETDIVDAKMQAVINTLVDQMNDGFQERDKRINGLERKIERVKMKYYAALGYIHSLLVLIPGGCDKVPPPVEIRDDLT